MDLDHVRPFLRQGFPLPSGIASRGKRIVGGHKPLNGALKGANTTLPNEATSSAPSEIPMAATAMVRLKGSSHGQMLPRERRSLAEGKPRFLTMRMSRKLPSQRLSIPFKKSARAFLKPL